MKYLVILLSFILLVGCTVEPNNIANTTEESNQAHTEQVNTEQVNTSNIESENTSVEKESNSSQESGNVADSDTETDENVSHDIELEKKLPSFQWQTLDDLTISPDDYLGKIVLLNFWTTWCPYCVQEMPDLEIVNEYDDVVVIAINSGESKDQIESFMEEHELDLEIVLDESGDISSMFYVSSLPTTYFLNEEGILLGGVPSMLTLEQLNKIIQDIRDDAL